MDTSEIKLPTPRQLETLQALFEFGCQKLAARHLSISPTTVKNHLANVREKLKTHNAMQSIYRAIALRLLVLPDPIEEAARTCAKVPAPSDWIEVGNLRLSPGSFEARVEDRPLILGHKAFQTLAILAQHPNRSYSRNQLIELTRGNSEIEWRVIDVDVSRLRNSLRDAGCNYSIKTVRGFGYALVRCLHHQRQPTANPENALTS